MPITQDRMLDIIGSARAFLTSWERLKNGLDEILAEVPDQQRQTLFELIHLTTPGYADVAVLAKEEMHFKHAASKNIMTKRAMRLRRGKPDIYADGLTPAKPLEHPREPRATQEQMAQRREEEAKKKAQKAAQHAGHTTYNLPDRDRAAPPDLSAGLFGAKPPTSEPQGLPEGSGTLDTQSEEYLEYLRQTGGVPDIKD